MTGYLWAVALVVGAQACVYSGIAFLSWYQGLPFYVKLTVALPTVFALGNTLFSLLYRAVPPLEAGAMSVVTGISAMALMTLLAERRAPNLTMVLGLVVTALGGCLVVYARRM